MSIIDKYEKQYRERRDVCGEPFYEVAAFFESYEGESARVLDLGCGQGRDALMVAHHGHSVLGVDSSQTGIRQMLEDAEAAGLKIEGLVADITAYEIDGNLNVIILDRVLHMLEQEERVRVLDHAVWHVAPEGYVLIADMPSSKAAFRDVFYGGSRKWLAVLDQRGSCSCGENPNSVIHHHETAIKRVPHSVFQAPSPARFVVSASWCMVASRLSLGGASAQPASLRSYTGEAEVPGRCGQAQPEHSPAKTEEAQCYTSSSCGRIV